jgi:hypothetical protein
VDEERRLLGVVKITVTEQRDWHPPGLTAGGRVTVTCEGVDSGVAESTLIRWAYDELSAKVLRAPLSRDDLKRQVASFDWSSVFKPGDVIRSRDGRMIGVVVMVGNYSPDDIPMYELHVDAAVDGVLTGGGIWEPWQAVPANDPESIAEAERLGLR